MDRVNKVVVAFLFLFLFLSISFGVGVGVGVGDESDNYEETSKKVPTNVIDAAKRLYSLPTTPSYSWFLHPNLDFRVGSNGNREGPEEEEGVTSVGGKVKDAVVKSLDNTKAALQDSANSAANTLNNLAQTL